MSSTSPVPSIEVPQRTRLHPWRELACYGWMVMELSWIALWSRMILRLDQQITYLRIVIVLTVIWMLIFSISRWMQRIDLKMTIRRAILLVLLIVCMALAFEMLLIEYGQIDISELLSRPVDTFQDMADLVPSEFLLILLVLFVSWRAISLADQQVAPFSIIAGFRIGILMFFFYALTGKWSEATPVIALGIFLFSSLLAMSTSRVAVLSQLRGGQSIPFDRRWMAGIAGSITVIVLGALGLALFLGGRGFSTLSFLFNGAIYLIVLIFSPLIILTLQLIMWVGELLNLANILAALLDLVKSVQGLIENILKTFNQWMSRLDSNVIRKVINWIVISRPVLMWGAILAVIVILLISLRQSIKRQEAKVDDQEVESLIKPEDLLDILKNAIRRSLRRFMDQVDSLTQFRRARSLFAAARIRRIYAKLLELSENLGEPRRESWTPLEFLPRLAGVFPAMGSELEMITKAYLRVRYGELPESFEEVAQVEQAWGKVRADGQERLREIKKRRIT